MGGVASMTSSKGKRPRSPLARIRCVTYSIQLVPLLAPELSRQNDEARIRKARTRHVPHDNVARFGPRRHGLDAVARVVKKGGHRMPCKGPEDPTNGDVVHGGKAEEKGWARRRRVSSASRERQRVRQKDWHFVPGATRPMTPMATATSRTAPAKR